MHDDHAADGLLLGRQPILDRQQAVIGYEFLFQASAPDATAQPQAGVGAAADVVCSAFAELGLARALGSQLAFIPADPDFLAHDMVQLLPAESVVLELDVAHELDADTLARCQELHGAGYRFALTGLRSVSDARHPLARLAGYAKLDIENGDAAALPGVVAQLRSLPLLLIAGKVETPAAFATASEIGFDAFQGYYFARPALVSGRKLEVGKQSLIRLVNLLQQDASTERIETVMKGEPGLVANLLRLTNSVAIGLPTRVTSVRQAITVLGRQQLQRWLQLLLFANGKGDVVLRTNPLMQLAALRGHFLELLVQRCYPARREMRDPAFIVGLMSVMPAALEIPMGDILEQISVAPDVRAALESRAGNLGQLLELIEHYDNNDVEAAGNMLAKMGGRLGRQTLNLCLTEAIAWMLELDSAAA